MKCVCFDVIRDDVTPYDYIERPIHHPLCPMHYREEARWTRVINEREKELCCAYLTHDQLERLASLPGIEILHVE